jgi:photosystem II stability/assembly factor-like uncharacterized protein
MKLIMKPRTLSYFLIAGMAAACSANRGTEGTEHVLANALATDSIQFNPTAKQHVVTTTTSILLQSRDGGLTWQDISDGLPEHEQPEGFFAGESDVYLHVKNGMYHSKSNLNTPVWEKENVPNLKSRSTSGRSSTLIAFIRTGAMAYNSDGQIYQKTFAADPVPRDIGSQRDWLPMHTNFKAQPLRTILETADGTLFLGYDHGLYKSVDQGQHWKQVHKGPVYDVVESAGVLLATRGTAIMRSTDHGENWAWIINEGRVGHSVEPIDGGFVAVTDGSVTKPRKIRISLDKGETWKAIDAGLPPSFSISSIKQLGNHLICGHPEGIFRSSDMGQTWTRVYTAVEESRNAKQFIEASYNSRVNVSKKVFTIYASGNTLYAVAKIPGC